MLYLIMGGKGQGKTTLVKKLLSENTDANYLF